MQTKRPGRFPLSLLALSLVVAPTAFAGPPTDGTDAATEANVTRLTTYLLEHSQFSHRQLDAQLAGKFLDRYLDALDTDHALFLKSDVDEFSAYGATLVQATREAGDTRPAHAIFRRFLQRMEERAAYVRTLLRAPKFDFTGHDTYAIDRAQAPRPTDLAAAQKLWAQQVRWEYLQEKLADKKPAQIVKTLTNRREQQLRTIKKLGSDEILELYLNALAHVYDPHSDYLGREQMESLQIAMNLSLFGIGAVLQSEEGRCKIAELVPGGPAARSELLKPGDQIVAVAQAKGEPVDIVNMPLSHAVQLIRGPKGTTVTLTIVPASAVDGSLPKTVSLVRDEIKLEDQAAKARIIDLPAGAGATVRLGVLDLPSFYADFGKGGHGSHRSATADVARLLTKLKAEQVRGVVLDLRANGGGSLEEAINLTGLFIRRGPVVQTKGPDGDIQVGKDDDGLVLYDGPLVVLISRFSASASEILAGALQDYGRAVIVGDSSTFGKGTVQDVLPLARVMDDAHVAHAFDPGALKITIRKFYRPSGASTQLRGVASDIVLPSTSDFADVSESSLTDPLPWDTIASARFENVNRVKPYVAALKETSLKRVRTSKEFAEVQSDIERTKKMLATKTVSLNEAERRQELAQAKARKEQRKREAQQAKANGPATYEITLKNAAAPGLPAPVAKADVPETSKIERAPSDNAVLKESVQILADYVRLSGGGKPAEGAPTPSR